MMSKWTRFAVASFLLAGSSLGTPTDASKITPATISTGEVVARVNGVALSERDLRLEMERQFPYYSVHGGRVPAHLEPEIRKKALDRIVLEELLFQEARRQKMEASPQEVEARIDQVRRKFTSKADFDRLVEEQFGSEKEFRYRTCRALMAEALWNLWVIRPSSITESEVREFYRLNRHRFLQPETVWLQTISFQFSEQASPAERDQARARAEQVLPQARTAMSFQNFGALAEKFSTDDWRVMNGDHGWVHRGTLDHELEVAFQMQPNETSGIISSRTGYHILRVNGYRPKKLVPYAEVKTSIRKSLQEESARKKGEQIERQLKSKARIEIP